MLNQLIHNVARPADPNFGDRSPNNTEKGAKMIPTNENTVKASVKVVGLSRRVPFDLIFLRSGTFKGTLSILRSGRVG